MEEAPTPETVNEPKGDIEHLKKFSATYKENVKYEISIYKRGTHFIIETEIPKDSQTIKYSNYYDLDSLKQTNKFFMLCDSIDDIIDTIYENTTNYICNINENHNNYEIKIPVPVKNIKEITFILKERIKTQKEIINELVSNSILLKKKIEEQNQKIEDQGKKEEELNKKINQLEIKVMNLEEQNKKIKDELKEILKNEIHQNRDNIRLVKTCNNLFAGAMIPDRKNTGAGMGGMFDRLNKTKRDKIRLVKTCNNLFTGAMIPYRNNTGAGMGGLFDHLTKTKRDKIRLVKTCNNLFPGAMIPCGNDTEMGGLFDRIINELKNEEEKNTHINITPIVNSKSKIIYYELFKQLNNWIDTSKSLKFELIFTASINGVSCDDFHKYCDGKGPTVTIVKGKNGHIFGGYVTVPFSSDCKSHYDDKAFLFSLTNMKKFPIKIKKQAVCHYSNWGPYIGYKDKCDLAIDSYCLKNKQSYCEPNSYEFERVDLIGTSERNFGVEDYEVYLLN